MTDKDQRTQSRAPSIGRSEPAQTSDRQALRQRAEAHLPTALSLGDIQSLAPEAACQVVHELHVHQIELEMQNEELLESQVALDEARARYFDLYDLAPVGYCTVSEQGLIVQSNLTAASLLGATRSALVKQALSRFTHRDDEDSYYLLRQRLVTSGSPQSCELRMVKNDGARLWVQLAATVSTMCRLLCVSRLHQHQRLRHAHHRRVVRLYLERDVLRFVNVGTSARHRKNTH